MMMTAALRVPACRCRLAATTLPWWATARPLHRRRRGRGRRRPTEEMGLRMRRAPPPPPPRVLPGGGTVWGAGLDWEGARLDATWLRAFIAARGGGFEADAGYHVGRTFLKALLAQPPVIVTAPPTAAAADGALSPPDGPGGDADDATRAAAASATAANAAPATPATSASGGAAERPADSSSDGGLEEDAAGAPAGAVARGGFHMVDTRRLAQAVLTERLAVAAEWKAALAGVPAEHAALRRELLQKSLDASA